jgi:hypothetical protein
MFPGMTEQQLTSVVDAIASFFARG